MIGGRGCRFKGFEARGEPVFSCRVAAPEDTTPIMAKRNGSRLVIVNRESTDQDELADLVINAEIGATMSRAVGVN